MNKKLIAVAIGAALSGSAFAQSSNVTLYGRIHQAVESVETNTDVNRDPRSQRNLQGLGSRIGVRGVEDLGGGLKGVFGFEAGVNSDESEQASNGATAAAKTNNTGNAFGITRNAYVGLDTGSTGRVVIGILDGAVNAPLYSQIFKAITDINHDVGTAQFASGRGDTLRGNQRLTDAIGYDVTVSGVQVAARYAMSTAVAQPAGTNNVAGAANGEQGGNNFSIAATTKMGAFDLGAGYEREDYSVNALRIAADTFKNRVQGVVGYTDGPLKVGLTLARNNFTDATRGATNLQDSENEYGISGAYKIGAKGQAIVNYFNRDVAGTANAERSQTQVGYKYNFSNRTMAYGMIQRLDTNTKTNASDSRAVIVGVRHNF